jgi:phosphatidylglycerol---prolipoprotein diacylglyceryl transferase
VVANYWSYYGAHPAAALRFWAGLHAGGAIAALVVAAPFVVRGVPVARLGDALVPTVGIGIVLARVGCFLHGCCFGSVCMLPWCLSFPAGSPSHAHQAATGLLAPAAVHALPVHPLQLYFAATGLLIIVVGVCLHPRKRYDGQVALVALLFFSASAAALEPFRAEIPERVYWGPLPQLEWVALAMTAAAGAALAAAERAHRSAPHARRASAPA